ncbi:unnamed protein product [Closterium sp. NIES-53]
MSLHLVVPPLFALVVAFLVCVLLVFPAHTLWHFVLPLFHCVFLPAPPESSLPALPDPDSDRARAAGSTISRILATVVTDPSFESALVSELSASPPSFGGECALGMDVLEDRQEDFECLAVAVPHFASMLLAPEGDPDAPDILTPRSFAEVITVPPSQANIVDGMWICRREYELHSRDSSTAFLHGSLHEEIWLRRPPGFTESFLARFTPSTGDPSPFLRTNTLLPPFYVLVYVNDLVFATADTEALALVKSKLQKTLNFTDVGELRNYLGLQITWDRARRTITLTQSYMVH